MNVVLPHSPQRPQHAQRAPATLRVFFKPGNHRLNCTAPALAAVLTPPHIGAMAKRDTAKRDDFTAAMRDTHGEAIVCDDRAVSLGDTFEGKLFGCRTSTPITILAAIPTEHYKMRITVMAGSTLPAYPSVATLWLYVAWGDIWTSPDMGLERAFVSYLGYQFARRHTRDPRVKRRRLDSIAE
jgi:hypothetical protein